VVYLTILESIVYLFFVNWLIRRSRFPSAIIFVFVALIMLINIEWISPLIRVFALLTWLGTVVWKALKGTRRQYLVLSLLLLFVVFAYPIWLQCSYINTLNRLREPYPFESLADRAPPPARMPSGPLPDATLARLDKLEEDATTVMHTAARPGLSRACIDSRSSALSTCLGLDERGRHALSK